MIVLAAELSFVRFLMDIRLQVLSDGFALANYNQSVGVVSYANVGEICADPR